MPQNFVSIQVSRQELAFGIYGLNRLTSRELQVLQLYVDGRSDKEAAKKISISVRTIDTYKRNIRNKLGVMSMLEILKILYVLAQQE